MTGGQRRGAPPPDDQPLVWNVAGLLGEPPGSHRDYAFDGVTIDLGEDLRAALDDRTLGAWGAEPPVIFFSGARWIALILAIAAVVKGCAST